MEKRLYFCDICGDEIKIGESCHEITIEGATVVQHAYTEDRVIDDCKDWIKLIACDKCYNHDKNESLIVSRYETKRDERNKRMLEEEQNMRQLKGV